MVYANILGFVFGRVIYLVYYGFTVGFLVFVESLKNYHVIEDLNWVLY